MEHGGRANGPMGGRTDGRESQAGGECLAGMCRRSRHEAEIDQFKTLLKDAHEALISLKNTMTLMGPLLGTVKKAARAAGTGGSKEQRP